MIIIDNVNANRISDFMIDLDIHYPDLIKSEISGRCCHIGNHFIKFTNVWYDYEKQISLFDEVK